MDRKEATQNRSFKRFFKKLLFLCVLGATAGYLAYHYALSSGKLLEATAEKTAEKTNLSEPEKIPPTLAAAFKSFFKKAEKLKQADEENYRLRLENINLRRWGETLRFDCAAQEAATESRKLNQTLTNETGSKVGRVLASIEYRPPVHLLPRQLFTLGVSYFNAGETEKAAVIFTFLTAMEEKGEFQTARNLLLTGVSWYRLDQYKLAEIYFDRVLEFNPKETLEADLLKHQAQARLWRALAAKEQKNHRVSQARLRDLLDHHPRSREAALVNGDFSIRPGANSQDASSQGASPVNEEKEREPASPKRHD